MSISLNSMLCNVFLSDFELKALLGFVFIFMTCCIQVKFEQVSFQAETLWPDYHYRQSNNVESVWKNLLCIMDMSPLPAAPLLSYWLSIYPRNLPRISEDDDLPNSTFNLHILCPCVLALRKKTCNVWTCPPSLLLLSFLTDFQSTQKSDQAQWGGRLFFPTFSFQIWCPLRLSFY